MRTPILAFLALVFGLGAAYGVWHYMTVNKPSDPEIDVIQVRVADTANPTKSDIPPNTQLKASMFEVVKKKQSQVGELKDQLALGGVAGRDIKDLAERRSKTKLKAGQPILFELQTDLPGAMGIEQQLKPGEVAVTVQGNINEFGGGHLKPRMTVDVMAKFKDPNSGKDRVAILFKEIEVLAVAAFEQAPPDGQAMVPDRVLLRMTYAQSLRMKYFKDIGSISLLLRSRDTKDIEAVTYDPTAESLFADAAKEPGKQEAEPTKKPDGNQGTAPKPDKPREDTGPKRVEVDEPMRIYTGTDVKTFTRKVIRELAPAGTKAAASAATKDEPKQEEPKQAEPKKDEPMKDATRGEGGK